ncbi:hypothetical protein GH714_035828 [Hevea brasiliensis]|uniref:Uncharacterized protein n=1 Tax=Hevea brasiliensis TaxID=3981 RepID=A0A6A6L032_HEVBR|nr:hypothetical protein GH714_035828 [Hevea brasiliensis]
MAEKNLPSSRKNHSGVPLFPGPLFKAVMERICSCWKTHGQGVRDGQSHGLDVEMSLGHAGAAIAYRSFLLRGTQFPESLMKFNLKRRSSTKKAKNHESTVMNPVEMAKEHFLVAAKAGSALGLKWLPRLEEEEKRLLTERSSKDLYQAKLIHLKLDICDTSGIPYYLMFDQRPINILH